MWLISDDQQLSAEAKEIFSDPASEVYLSSVSAWEIIVKNMRQKLPLPKSPQLFIPEQRKKHGIDVLPLDEESVLQLQFLPARHKDPFDRMLICQAIAHGMIILTPDPLITQYPVRTIW